MKSRNLLLEQIVFEARYKQGYRYFDRCGETMIEIEDKIEGWSAEGISEATARMKNEEERMFFNFGSSKLDLAQYGTKDLDCKNFFSDLKNFFNIVSRDLGIKEYLRFGLRYWFLYPIDSPDEGRRILSRCKTFSINKDIEELFGKKITDTSITIMLEQEQKGHRISLSMAYRTETDIEKEENNILLKTPPHKLPTGQKEALKTQLQMRKKQKKLPRRAILIDIDNYMKNPQAEFLDNFIDEATKLSTKNALKLIGG